MAEVTDRDEEAAEEAFGEEENIALVQAVGMFEKLNVPVFGLVENMSYFICPHCGEQTDIFGTGGAEAMADELGIDFLGGIPLHPDVRQGSDNGVPIVEADPESPVAKAFGQIAQRVAAKTSVQHFFAEAATAG